MLDISCESSAWQRIHMKQQALSSSKDKSKKKIQVSSAANLLGALRVKVETKVYNQSAEALSVLLR